MVIKQYTRPTGETVQFHWYKPNVCITIDGEETSAHTMTDGLYATAMRFAMAWKAEDMHIYLTLGS
jgi:hypothetical protein